VYRLADVPVDSSRFGNIFGAARPRSTSSMPIRVRAAKMSPHFHDDLNRSAEIDGDYVHHIRTL
jgi:hypothetical protein